MKIGIFGGSFNPPHKMHKQIASSLIEKGYVDKIVIVPTGNLYEKPELIDGGQRYRMLEIMTENDKNISVSDFELSSKLHYTYETLEHFKKIYPNDDIYFILGSDNLKEIRTWLKYDYMLKNYYFLVILRDNDEIELLKNDLIEYKEHLVFCTLEKQATSSRNIREKLKKNDFDIEELDPSVLQYIISNKLY